MNSKKRLKFHELSAIILILTGLFFAPLGASAAKTDIETIEANVALLQKYEDWFFDETALDKSPANDFYDKKPLPKGVVPYLKLWQNDLCLYERPNKTSQSVCDETWSEETVRNMNEKWLEACEKSGDLIRGSEGKGFLPLQKELLSLAKDKGTTDSTRKKIRDLSNKVIAEAKKAITTNSCVNVRANIHMVFDDNDYHCLAEKVLNPTKSIKNTSDVVMKREDQFTNGNCAETNYHSSEWWNVPGCNASSCKVDARIGPDAEAFDYYNFDKPTIGISPLTGQIVTIDKSKDWKAYYSQAVAELNGLYKNKEALAKEREQNIAKKTASAASELRKGSVVGLSLPLSDISLPSLIRRVINRVLGIVGALGLVGFIYGGIVYMTATGSSDRAEKGRKVLVWSTLGLVTIFSAYAIVSFLIKALTKKI